MDFLNNNYDDLEEYMKMLPEIRKLLTLEKFSEYPEDVKKAFVQELSQNNITNEYKDLQSKIKTFISNEIFDRMPSDIKDFLLKAKGSDLKDSQLLFLSKIPWGKCTIEDIPIPSVKRILDETHSGMAQVKERILKYIACQRRIGTNYGAVLLLVGPPGVGKTSIAKAIANAMGRKFVKISLAGTADADFIRGTSSIYSDSKPGMIIESIIEAENFAPLILLDEIDKMGASTQHGSPEHALLHILDSDRKVFVDDFLSIPIDLSQVIFVATANNTSNLSPILLDRLEIIKLNGYSKKEKMDILDKHIFPRLYQEYKLDTIDLSFSKKVAEYIIDNFTNEPGVRSLEQIIRNIFETIVFFIENKSPYSSELTIGEVNQILGVSSSKHKKKQRRTIEKTITEIKKREDLYS